jgi:hypothetical protein
MMTFAEIALVLSGAGFTYLAKASGHQVSMPPRRDFDAPRLQLNRRMTIFMFVTIACAALSELVVVGGVLKELSEAPVVIAAILSALLLVAASVLYQELREQARLCGLLGPRIRADRV